MYKVIFLLIAECLLSISLSAQNALDSLMSHYANLYKSGTEFLIVKGRLTGNYSSQLNNVFNSWGQKYYKYEDELDSADLKKHLQFYGPIRSYNNLYKYLPKVMKITDKGFSFGNLNFNDSLDAISLISSEGDRWFQLGNSMSGLASLWTTFQDMSQYFIMQNWAITYHGFLNDNAFDPKRHYDVSKLRREKLLEKDTKYYKFYYDPGVFSSMQNIDSLFRSEDAKYENVIHFFGLSYPSRKIECFLYKDLEQKYYLSATPGFGNPFPRAFQNHSVGFAPVEHETIHILLDNLFGEHSTFISEGMVGYYYSSSDTMQWKRTRMIVSSRPDFNLESYLNSQEFNFSSFDYAAAAYFMKYLIDTYGLEKCKTFLKTAGDSSAYKEVYGMSMNEIAKEWKEYYNNTKVPLGPERKIIIRVVSKNIPENSKIYVTGEGEKLLSWNPAGVELIKQPGGYWEKEFMFPAGSIITYKITRGSWDQEALDKQGNVPSNSIYEVKGDDILKLTIDKWKDVK